ncbi:MAG TPA: zinc ribbon domain-containing protein [Dehalococcoidia bacterium]|jgi:putative FmdB family regulatory protein|nr:zinc ribbon domain-containing protein [Dehalococcoidia bacterium]
MAIYEFFCAQCRAVFEVRRPMTEAHEAAPCPKCGSQGQKLVSGFGSKTGSYIQAPTKPFRELPS